MIHSATVDVTCDAKNCMSTEHVELDYGYDNYSGKSGGYISDDASIEENLVSRHEWVVVDGKHYCCQECAEEADNG